MADKLLCRWLLRNQEKHFAQAVFMPFFGVFPSQKLLSADESCLTKSFLVKAEGDGISAAHLLLVGKLGPLISQLCECGGKGAKLGHSVPKELISFCKGTNYLLESMYLSSLQSLWKQIH